MHSEDFDQTGQMPRLIRVFAGRRLIMLVLLCHGSNTVTKTKRETHLVLSFVVVQYKSVQCVGEFEINDDKIRLHRD